jgi:aspartokinase
MPAPARLGGFKVLKDVVRISLIQSGKNDSLPAGFFHMLAQEKINLPFLTCGREDLGWGLSIVVESHNAQKASSLVEENFCKIDLPTAKWAILSIFPHRSNPEIMASLLHLLGREGVEPEALAHSTSAISAVLREEVVSKVTRALFGPFRFSAYRTPADWSLAQTGKERLYKEVVASYQEKKPKVYALEWQDGQDLLRASMETQDLGVMGTALKGLSQLKFSLTFLIMTPSQAKRETNLFFCIPKSDKGSYSDMIKGLSPGIITSRASPVALFSMNGPHFGDRYGIASELFFALKRAQVELLALSCSIASIAGVVPAEHVHSAIHAIQACFDVPLVTKRA